MFSCKSSWRYPGWVSVLIWGCSFESFLLIILNFILMIWKKPHLVHITFFLFILIYKFTIMIFRASVHIHTYIYIVIYIYIIKIKNGVLPLKRINRCNNTSGWCYYFCKHLAQWILFNLQGTSRTQPKSITIFWKYMKYSANLHNNQYIS